MTGSKSLGSSAKGFLLSVSGTPCSSLRQARGLGVRGLFCFAFDFVCRFATALSGQFYLAPTMGVRFDHGSGLVGVQKACTSGWVFRMASNLCSHSYKERRGRVMARAGG